MNNLEKRFIKVDLNSIEQEIKKSEISDFMALSMRERAELLLIGQRLKKAFRHEHLNYNDFLYLLSLEPEFSDDLASQINELVQECIRHNMTVSSSSKTRSNVPQRPTEANDQEQEQEIVHLQPAKERVIQKPKFNI